MREFRPGDCVETKRRMRCAGCSTHCEATAVAGPGFNSNAFLPGAPCGLHEPGISAGGPGMRWARISHHGPGERAVVARKAPASVRAVGDLRKRSPPVDPALRK